VAGSFNDDGQRNYLRDLLKKAFDIAGGNVSALVIQIQDKNKDIQAQISVTSTTQCVTVGPPPGFACISGLGPTIEFGLELILISFAGTTTGSIRSGALRVVYAAMDFLTTAEWRKGHLRLRMHQ
jgi:hypothetical protein